MPIAGSMLLVLGVFQVIRDLRTTKQRKVLDRLNESSTKKKEQQFAESLLRQKSGDVQGNFLEVVISKLKMVDRLQKILDQADVRWSASRTLLNLTGLAVVSGFLLALLGVSVFVSILAGFGMMFLPLLWLIRKRKKRIQALVEQLPDVFDLMSQALRAGNALA